MAKKANVCTISSCGYCNPCWGLVLIIIGILYLLMDYGIITWFGLSWYTTVFILLGIGMICCRK